MPPRISAYFQSRQPSGIRTAQIEFEKRTDGTEALNVAIGNVSLPMHPAMTARMESLGAEGSPVRGGVVRYSATVGLEETNRAFLNIIASCGFDTEGLYSQVTDGSSQAMELTILAICGPAGTAEKPLLLIDPAYTNYNAMAARTGRATVQVTRHLQEDGAFALPSLHEIERTIGEHRPGALLVIPYDNPTGQFTDHETMVELARLCVRYDLWMVSDEAYRQLYYGDKSMSSIWRLAEEEVPGIVGRRVSLESASKVFNACGLRIGAMITDNEEYHQRAVAEFTANLCPPMIDQYIFGSLAHVSGEDLLRWYAQQRAYYQPMLSEMVEGMTRLLPGVIISKPESSIYSVVDVRNVVKPGFDALDFVTYCAGEGRVDADRLHPADELHPADGRAMTLLVAPMAGFYGVKEGEENPGTTQMRIAYVASPEEMRQVPRLFSELLRQYEAQRG
jgi:aspartate aminotransferase